MIDGKENCYAHIPKYWNEYIALDRKPFKGQFGVCIDRDKTIHYLIADIYYPWISAMSEWESVTFEAGLWAMFSADGSLPESLQKVDTYVWEEWVTDNKEYILRANYNLEFYPHEKRDSEYTHSEIWVPVRKAE